MGSLVFQANLGGSVTLVGPNTASTFSLTLPSATGSSGQFLQTDGTGVLSFASAVTAAAGSNTQVQYNSSGAFAGSANLTFNGTTLTAAGLATGGNLTLSGGTANGVAYLNGSKVVTSGSALTFDGTNLGVGTNLLLTKFTVQDTERLEFGGASGVMYSQTLNAARTATVEQRSYASFSSWWVGAAGSQSEQMRLITTGLGIGTSSPATKLDVAGPIRAQGYTVATLPTGVVGARAYVTDAVTAVFMAVPTGGGSVKTPVFYNGSNWVCG